MAALIQEIIMSKQNRPLVGISVGDPGGIGPEVTVKALLLDEIYDICRPVVISDFDVMKDAVEIANAQVALNTVDSPDEGQYELGIIDVIDMHNVDISKLDYGKISAENGRASYQYIAKVIELALRGKIDATVTGPIHKEALNAAGYHYAGHTEIYSTLTNTKDYAMMLADGDFRIVHVSTHVSLRKACDLVKKERVLKTIHLTYRMLMDLGVEGYRIGVAGLNPHAGENGLFGDEEIREITPAINAAKADGINVEGPIPSDTVFSRARGGDFDAVVAMYHDQGHIAMKTAGFLYSGNGQWSAISGVNVTLGLPIIRTSVDHGVAFDKAGKGNANPQSMVQAIKMACRLTRK